MNGLSMKNNTKSFGLIGLSLIAAILLIGGAYWWLSQQTRPTTSTPSGQTSQEVRLEGHLVCLPKKGSGPQTMECAYGLQAEGKYYGLQTNSDPDQNLMNYTFSDTLEISGTLTSPASDATYDIEGVIKVRSITLVAGQS